MKSEKIAFNKYLVIPSHPKESLIRKIKQKILELHDNNKRLTNIKTRMRNLEKKMEESKKMIEKNLKEINKIQKELD